MADEVNGDGSPAVKPTGTETPPSSGDVKPPAGDPAANPQTVPYSRFQEVNASYRDLQTRLAKIEADKKTAEDAALADQGKFKDLHEQEKKRAADLERQLQSDRVDFALEREIMARVSFDDVAKRKANVDAVSKLVDRSKITFADGKASGADEAIKSVQELYPELFASSTAPKPPPDPKSVNNGKPGIGDVSSLTPQDIMKLSKDQFAELDRKMMGK